MGSMQKALLLPKYDDHLQEKHLWVELVGFSLLEFHFYCKEWLIENYCLFRRVFCGHFLKVKRQPLTSRKNDGYLLPMIKFEISSKIYNFVKLVCATRSWRLPMTQTFLMRWVRLFIFFILYNGFCQHFRSALAQWANIFWMINTWSYKIMHE